MYCTNCGSFIQDNQRFCGKCGEPVKPNSQTGYIRPSNPPAPNLAENTISDKDLALFVGKKSALYLNKWKNNSEWNWPAFLFDFYWMLYRKMYLYALLSVLIVSAWSMFVALLISVITPLYVNIILIPVLILIPKIATGVLANKLYLHHAKRKIAGLRSNRLEEKVQDNLIIMKGGTNIVLVLLIMIGPYLLGFLLVALIYYFNFTKSLDSASSTTYPPIAMQTPDPQTASPPEAQNIGTFNVLLLGGDARKSAPLSSSDSMIVASIAPATNQVHLFSILRDTYVDMPGIYQGTIGEAIAAGDFDLTIQTAENLTGLSIPYYLYTDFDGFVNLIDKLGGIDLEVEKDMDYVDFHDLPEYDIQLEEGYQHLDGAAALQYVRFRHDAMGDFARVERQQNLLHALAQKIITNTTIMDLPGIINAIKPCFQTNFSLDDLLYLAQFSLKIDPDSISSTQLPPMDNLQQQSVNGKSVLEVIAPEELQTYVKTILETVLEEVYPESI
ncbi:LCP family protein [Gorillibacterium massiliense]|uniref:LCP family glycopolymer transferase n=1 Tax=Gorillibacterium massiliense TaxID=1280390 RepID=UPI0004B05A8F|nr:LCP family protein [Gorillibacterium massiliense]